MEDSVCLVSATPRIVSSGGHVSKKLMSSAHPCEQPVPDQAFQALKEMDRTRPYPLHCRVRLEPVNDPNHPDDPPSPNPSHAPTLSSSRATSQDDMTFYASAVAASKAT